MKNSKSILILGASGITGAAIAKRMKLEYNAYGIVSDSGTSQEECPLLGIPVVPRNTTERPESVEFGNSILIWESEPIKKMTSEQLGSLTPTQFLKIK